MASAVTVPATPGNSTNVRPPPPRLRVPTWFKFGLRWSGRISPALGGAIATHLFFRPRRLSRPPRERLWQEAVTRTDQVIAGQRIAVYRQGEGPAVLLVHGWQGRASQLGAIANAIVARGFQVVAFDGPGHGESAGDSCDVVAMLGVARVLGEQLLDERGRLPAVVGHSMGGTVSIIAAADGLRAEKVVSVASPASVGSFMATFRELLELEPEIERQVRQRVDARVGADAWWRLSPEGRARQLTCPGLIVHDRGDGEVSLSEAQALERAWSGARLLTTEGLGHTRVLWDPATAHRIAAFIADASLTS